MFFRFCLLIIVFIPTILLAEPDSIQMGCSKKENNNENHCHKEIVDSNGINLEALQNRFGDVFKKDAQKKENPEILVLVSLGMPEQSLKNFKTELEKVNGTLVLRGFLENSIQKTVDATSKLFGDEKEGGFSIDPEIFQTLDVKQVPAIVLCHKGLNACRNDESDSVLYDVVYGDISLIDALIQIERNGSIAGREIATSFIKQYREKSHDKES